MSGRATLESIAGYLDGLLRIPELPDYPNALNGLQLANRGKVTRVAASVDISRRVIEQTIQAGANLLIVHHGMFWGGLQPLRGTQYERIRLLLDNDIAVYSAHLPLDAHPEVGNNALLAHELGLTPRGGFAEYHGLMVGVRGDADVPTATLVERANAFASRHGGVARATWNVSGRITRSWAICTGAGASADTMAEASAAGIDTLIVGEGPHWTAVDAPEAGLVIIYAGHYATETLGVRALAERVAEHAGIPWSFVEAPTGL
jgi:dinuclear metal center YbgI/SA1388 family protein